MKKISKKDLIILGFWATIMVLIWFREAEDMSFVERILGFVSFTGGSVLVSILFSKTLFNKTVSLGKIISFLLKFLIMTVSLALVYVLLFRLFMFLEMNGFFNATHFINEYKTIDITIKESIPGLVSSNLLFCGILLYYEYSELRNVNLQYQLQILHSQVNPHFMFNVLNHIYLLMQKDVDRASALLLKYSDVLRYQLYNGKGGKVTLDQEVQFLKNYIDVEKFRWEGKVDVTVNWSVENANYEIAPLILITFIENAFKYVSRSDRQKGFIKIDLEQKSNILTLEVENSKTVKKDNKKNNTGLGLENVKARLNILYPKRHDLIIENTDNIYKSKLTVKL